MAELFVIPLWADLLAVGIGALQGALFAAQFRDRRLDWLGVAIIGIVVGFGGGLLRDLLLDVPLAPLQSNWYVVVATGAALLGMLLERVFSRLNRLITLLDALTIGLFGASTGAAAALAAAARRTSIVRAVVSRGGRPDLARDRLAEVRAPTLLIVGGEDHPVIELNVQAAKRIAGPVKVQIVPGATHLFEEPGKLEEVAKLARAWFEQYLVEREKFREPIPLGGL